MVTWLVFYQEIGMKTIDASFLAQMHGAFGFNLGATPSMPTITSLSEVVPEPFSHHNVRGFYQDLVRQIGESKIARHNGLKPFSPVILNPNADKPWTLKDFFSNYTEFGFTFNWEAMQKGGARLKVEGADRSKVQISLRLDSPRSPEQVVQSAHLSHTPDGTPDFSEVAGTFIPETLRLYFPDVFSGLDLKSESDMRVALLRLSSQIYTHEKQREWGKGLVGYLGVSTAHYGFQHAREVRESEKGVVPVDAKASYGRDLPSPLETLSAVASAGFLPAAGLREESRGVALLTLSLKRALDQKTLIFQISEIRREMGLTPPSPLLHSLFEALRHKIDLETLLAGNE